MEDVPLHMTDSFDRPETFEPVADLTRTTLRNGLVLLIPLAFITWVIITLILGGLGVPVPWLFGIVLSLVFIVTISKARAKKLDAMVEAMSLTLDPHGITERNTVATRSVSWEGLRAAGMVKPVVGMSVGQLGRGRDRSRSPVVDALGSAAAVKELGLLGVGTVQLAPDANAMTRTTYHQNETLNGVDAPTGQPLVALYLQQFRRDWPEERIGEWINHFRPDVFAQAKALHDEQAHLASMSMRDLAKESWAKGKAQAAAEKAGAEKHDEPPDQST